MTDAVASSSDVHGWWYTTLSDNRKRCDSLIRLGSFHPITVSEDPRPENTQAIGVCVDGLPIARRSDDFFTDAGRCPEHDDRDGFSPGEGWLYFETAAALRNRRFRVESDGCPLVPRRGA